MDFNARPNYRAQAEKCVELAERAKDRETELHWFSMAQACLVLADAWEMEAHKDVLARSLCSSFDHNSSPTRH